MRMMTGYEWKKVFSRRGGKIALLLLAMTTAVVCWFSCSVSYVDETGVAKSGFLAVAKLRAQTKEWAGILDEDKIRQVIAENKRITQSAQYLSEDVTENNMAYHRTQAIRGIRDLLNSSYAEGFRSYDYYRANKLGEEDAPQFYGNRAALLGEWLRGEARDQFSEEEKTYLMERYESQETPFFYDYVEGWSRLFEYAPAIVMITMLILGYLVAGIFSCEFTWKSDAIFFSSIYGRNRATAAKLRAGFGIVTLVYFVVMLTYSAVTLLYLGADGWNCPIQIIRWKSFYQLEVWQEYLLILTGGYIGCLFMSFLGMLVSAKTKSAVIAVTVPFVLIFLPSFLMNIDNPVINRVICLLPDQLLQIGTALGYFSLYSLGGRIVGAVPILIVLYTALAVVLMPVVYLVYGRRQVG